VLSPALEGTPGVADIADVGCIGYYADVRGAGPAVVLIHSVNAAASAYEMRPLFDALRGKRRVYAMDLPGFGSSDRTDRHYTPDLYARAITRFVADIASPEGEPVDAVALSLSAEFLARAAMWSPARYRALTLLSPTGFADDQRAPRALGLRAGIARLPMASDALFSLLRSERSIRYFLQKGFAGPVDEGALRYAVETAAMPGAKHAPLAFLSGALFTPDAARALYADLTVPTTVIHDDDAYTSFERLDAVTRANPRITRARIGPSRGMAHFEQTPQVLEIVGGAAARARAAS
jgi:pimeloyl-ACP methyl ester carboxylesterase